MYESALWLFISNDIIEDAVIESKCCYNMSSFLLDKRLIYLLGLKGISMNHKKSESFIYAKGIQVPPINIERNHIIIDLFFNIINPPPNKIQHYWM